MTAAERRRATAVRTSVQMVRTMLDAAWSCATPEQRGLLAAVRGHIRTLGVGMEPSDPELLGMLAQHAVTRVVLYRTHPDLERNPRMRALDDALRSLLADPSPAGPAAIRHARGETR